MSFEINLIFPIKLFCLHEKKVKMKIYISWERQFLLVISINIGLLNFQP